MCCDLTAMEILKLQQLAHGNVAALDCVVLCVLWGFFFPNIESNLCYESILFKILLLRSHFYNNNTITH